MKRPTLKGRLGDTEPSSDEQTTETIIDALTSNDKVIEIRPAERSRTIGAKRLLLLGAGAIGLAYWVQNSQRPTDLVRSAKERTLGRTDRAAETIEAGSETASERIEEGSQRAGEAVREAGEEAADRTEEAGEKAAEKADDTSSFSRD
jgi:hypothetical protein